MWTFQLPTKILFGLNTASSLAGLPEVKGCRVVVVTCSDVADLPVIKERIKQIAPVAVFEDVRPNPTVANVDALTEILREEKAETVIAIGGGSPMDCAKAAVCLAVTENPSIRAYHSEGKCFFQKPIPLITVPTTAGTGSEVTPIAVLDDEEKNFKGPFSSPLFYPLCAVIDPLLTLSMPISVTAATAMDALSHAIEGYWSKQHQPICDTLAKDAAKIIFANLPDVYETPTDTAAREALSYAALIAGIAFQMPKNAIIHACSFPLSSRLSMPHGTACAFMMEAAIRWNASSMEGRMEELAGHCGFATMEAMIHAVTTLKRRGGLPCTLQEAGIDAGILDILVRESMHPLMNNNPRPVSEDDVRKLYQSLCE
ncbi:MAG: iron-containing alcohol dehydrogenase [Planctomycetaceae bacterium]|jgi:alcohol dehydrogenase|nr:iron-containing alcohol dehydrogenase [Planctomycetaceae bacterium]